jgi:hypothetical protein
MQADAFNVSTFDQYHVIHVKGKTTGVTAAQINEALAWIESEHRRAILEQKRLAIAWDGDDVKEGSFTEVLCNVPRSINALFIYALSCYSPYGVDATGDLRVPEGLHLLPLGERGDIYSVLCRSENQDPTFCGRIESVGAAVRESPLLMKLFRPGYSNRVGYPSRWEPVSSGNYGYWALGMAFVAMTGSKHIGFLGGGPVSIAEYAYLRSTIVPFSSYGQDPPHIELFGWGKREFDTLLDTVHLK